MKLGRLPAQFPAALKPLDYYASGPLPEPPAVVDPPLVPEWGMLGNDQYGDCGVAGIAHLFMADEAITHEPFTPFTTDEVVRYYLRFTDGQDSGVVLSQFLTYVRKWGFLDHHVSRFAPVPVHDVVSIQRSIYLFGCAYLGVAMPSSAQTQTLNGLPWSVVPDSPILGGHCVLGVGYDDHFLTVVTWGQLQQVTWSWWHRYAEEAWAVLTGEFVARHGDGRGFSLEALDADLARLAA